MLDDQLIQHIEVFHPFSADAYRRIIRKQVRFVHSTTAETATSIIRGQTVWMRNARVMNDFSEIEYGRELLVKAYHSPVGERLKRALEDPQPGITKEIEELFDGWVEPPVPCMHIPGVRFRTPEGGGPARPAFDVARLWWPNERRIGDEL